MTKKMLFARFLEDESGATAIEYGLIAALIGVGLIVGAKAFSTSVNDLFSGVDSEMVEAFGTSET
ncbi:MAG: Flp family type IVb pilin [Litorimonas sp.]